MKLAVFEWEPCSECKNKLINLAGRNDCAACGGKGGSWVTPGAPASILVWHDANDAETVDDFVLLAYRVSPQVVACNIARKSRSVWRTIYGELLPNPIAYAEVEIPSSVYEAGAA